MFGEYVPFSNAIPLLQMTPLGKGIAAGTEFETSFGKTDSNRFLEFWNSTDHGKTWEKRAVESRFVDRPFIVVDTTAPSAKAVNNTRLET